MAVEVINDYTGSQVRDDVSAELLSIIIKNPLMNWIPFGSPHGFNEEMKFIWMEETLQESNSLLDLQYTAASGTITIVAGTGIYSVGDIVYIDKHIDLNGLQLRFRVTEVGATTLTVTLIHGTDTTLALGTPPQPVFRQLPIADLAAPGTGTAAEPDLVFNYFQLFQEDVKLGQKAIDSSLQGNPYGIANLLDTGLRQKADAIVRQLYRALWFGIGTAEGANPASMKGIDQFVNTTSTANRVDAGSATITETMINNLLEQLGSNGLTPGDPLVLIGHPKQIRAISALKHTKTTYNEDENIFGSSIERYRPELSGYGTLGLIPDFNLTNDKLYMINQSKIEIVPPMPTSPAGSLPNPHPLRLGQRIPSTLGWLVDSLVKGTHGRQWTMRSHLSLKMKGALNNNGVIYDLT